MTEGMLDWKFLTEKKVATKIPPFYRWLLKTICKDIVVQGHFHKSCIIEYFEIMSEATKNEFTEDNKPTHDAFLQECLDKALKNETI